MIYRIDLYREAEKTLDGLDRTTARRYARVGDWRIIYRVNEAAGTLDIMAIRPRSRAYR